MFTWIPIHEEAAKRLLDFKDRSNELVGMKENIVIPIKIERLKTWTRRALETATWLICLGLLVASAVVAAGAALLWFVSGSEVILALGLGSGLRKIGAIAQMQAAAHHRQIDAKAAALDHGDDDVHIRIPG